MKYKLNECIGSRLRRLSRVVDGYYRKHFAGQNLTENQLTILFTLYETGSIQQGSLGKILALERSTISRNIRLLENSKLIRKTDDYRPEVELSMKGKNLAERIFPIWEHTMNELIGKIGEDGLQMISKLENKFK